MASPNQPPETRAQTSSETDTDNQSDHSDDRPPQIIKLRIAPWDVVCTLALLGGLLLVVSLTSWTSRLFGFTETICVTDDCAPVPYGVNYYIYPVMWGGIGVAVSAAVLGPFVSMVKGWYMSFWPIISIGVLTLTSVFCSALAGFSGRYG